MKRDTRYRAKVTVTERPPPADHLLQYVIKDPAGSSQLLLKYIQKDLKRREARRRAVEKHVNESGQQKAQRRKSIALKIAARLQQQEPELRQASASELAQRISTAWPQKECPPPKPRTIRRWLTEK
jgi:hypothetical protein